MTERHDPRGLQLPKTEEYQAFLKTWEGAVGLAAIFIEQTDAMVEAEIQAFVEPFTAELTKRLNQMAQRRDPVTLALGHLLTDLVTHLETHDCLAAGHPQRDCPIAQALVERLRKCQGVLGYARSDAPLGNAEAGRRTS